MITTAIQFPKELLERAGRYAETQDRPRSYIIRKALEKYLDENEETQREPAKAGKAK